MPQAQMSTRRASYASTKQSSDQVKLDSKMMQQLTPVRKQLRCNVRLAAAKAGRHVHGGLPRQAYHSGRAVVSNLDDSYYKKRPQRK
jgi:hypothetical protein